MQSYIYKAFGITFESELQLPELQIFEEPNPDVKIQFGSIPKNLPVLNDSGVLFQAAKGDFLFRVDFIAAYRVQKGSLITIECSKNVDFDIIRIFLYGSVMGALLFQRSCIPLHGSAIVSKHGKISLFSGSSAAGKSSLAAAFHKKGFQIFADDISSISLKDGRFLVSPGLPQIKLWKDVKDHLDIHRELKRIRPDLEKYYLPIDISPNSKPGLIQNIFIIKSKNNPEFQYTKLSGGEKFDVIYQNLYRPQFIHGMNLRNSIFKQIAQLSNRVNVEIIQRPSSPLSILKLLDFVEQRIASNE